MQVCVNKDRIADFAILCMDVGKAAPLVANFWQGPYDECDGQRVPYQHGVGIELHSMIVLCNGIDSWVVDVAFAVCVTMIVRVLTFLLSQVLVSCSDIGGVGLGTTFDATSQKLWATTFVDDSRCHLGLKMFQGIGVLFILLKACIGCWPQICVRVRRERRRREEYF